MKPRKSRRSKSRKRRTQKRSLKRSQKRSQKRRYGYRKGGGEEMIPPISNSILDYQMSHLYPK